MELFLLFSLALTCVAFLSIVLADPPSPLATGAEHSLPIGMIAPNATLAEATEGQARPMMETNLLETAAVEVAMKEYPAAV